MRYYFATAAVLLLSATPAHATQGLLCRAESGEVPQISLVIGAGGISGASLDEKGHWVSTMSRDARLVLAQAWIDNEQVMADIVGPTGDTVAKLRGRFDPPARGKPATAQGTLTLRGRTVAVRCEEN